MSNRDDMPVLVGIGDKIILSDSSRLLVAPRNLSVPGPRPFPEYSDVVPVSLEPGIVGRLPVLDPWPIWDDVSRAPQASNGDRSYLEVIVTDTDHDFAANGWANISIGSRRWRVPTGPGYPEDPNIPPSAPQPPPRAIRQDERAFSVRPAHWEFVLRNNEYHPVMVPAALSSVGSFRADTASPEELVLTPEQRAAGPHRGTVGRDHQFPRVEDPAGGVPPWSQSGPHESWIFDPNDYTVPSQPSPWVADRHGGVSVHRQVPPDTFPVPGSILVTRVRPQPNSVDEFDKINVRIHPISTMPVGANIQQEEPERSPSAEDVPPETDDSFFPLWIDNSLFREEKRVSVRKSTLSSEGGSDLVSLPPPYLASSFVQQPPCRFPPFEAQNVRQAPQGLQPAPRPGYYVGCGNRDANQYMGRFAPPGPMSEMSERSLDSDISERDLDEEEALWRRGAANSKAD